MTISRTQNVANGSLMTKVYYLTCDKCNIEFFEGDPHTNEGKFHFCNDCSFVKEKITEREYLSTIGLDIPIFHASVRDGNIVVWSGKKPPWEKTSKELRNTTVYKEWRKSVFARDDYTCQHCGQVGGELNAHHIKPYAKYKKLRYETSNGLTLCVSCHREEHKKKR